MWAKGKLAALGTTCRFLLEGQAAHDLIALAKNEVEADEAIFSAHLPSSALSQVNQAAGLSPVPVPSVLYDLIARGKEESLATDSRLNIALGPLTQAWHIGFPDAKHPLPASIKQLLPLCQPQLIKLNPNQKTIYLPKPGMSLDLGALAKGDIADRLLKKLVQAGARAALLDLGGTILTLGKSPSGQPFQVGVQTPFAPRGTSLGRLELSNQALVTSGTYERFFRDNGRAFHHILDGQTGRPMATEMTSLTILAPTALEGEIWTSKLFGLEISTALECINQAPDIEGLILTQGRQQFFSQGLRRHFKTTYHETSN